MAVADLIVRQAQLRRRRELVDIVVEGGVIAAISPRSKDSAEVEVSADGRLVTEALADPHCHIDKSLFGEVTHRYDYQEDTQVTDPSELKRRFGGHPRSGMGDMEFMHTNVVPLFETWAFKERYTVEDVRARILAVLRQGIGNGLLAMRMFCDVDTHAGLKGIEAAVQLRQELAGVMDLKVVAFPQEGIYTDPGTEQLMEEAMAIGTDVVGGIPSIEWDDRHIERHIDFCFDLAARHQADLHFLCDDSQDPYARALELVAAKKLESGFAGRVASSHNGALSYYPQDHATRVINLLAQAKVDICANAHVNLLGAYTRVPELLAAGITVAAGQDDVDNFYYPFGQPDPLEIAWVVAHAAHLAHPDGVEVAFDMVSQNAKRVMGLDHGGIRVGAQADLIVHEAANVRDALRFRRPRPYVISHGRVVAEARVDRRLNV